ncbi:MAG: hypothetical protein ACLFRI_01325 [Candidatus Izemoplasmataceae bacterium]
MRKVLALIFMLVAVFTVAACGPSSTEASAYGVVHGHYVGVADITVDKDGVVTDLTLEEYFLPYSWGKVDASNADREDVLGVVGTRRGGDSSNTEDHVTTYYAKYLQIGDELFTGAVTGDAGSQSIVYSTDDIADLDVYVETEENAKWYVDQILAEEVYIANEDGTENTELETIESDASSVTLNKSDSGYWSTGDRGWLGNRDATVDAIIGLNLSEEFTTVRGEDNFWSINDTVTGATWSDFNDYFNLAQQAYDNATE